MSRSTPNERLKKIDAQLAQLRAKKQAIINREKEKERKARTRRLIQNGALAEQYLHAVNMEPQNFEQLLRHLAAIPAVQMLLAGQVGVSATAVTSVLRKNQSPISKESGCNP